MGAAQTRRTQTVINQRAHYIIAERKEHLRLLLGVPATVIAAIVAALTVARPTGSWVYVIGAVATVGAILVGLQTFLKPEERAREHRAAGIEYGTIGRQFDLAIAQGDGPHILETLETLYPELDRIARASPVIPDKPYRTAQREVEATGTTGRGEVTGVG
jgi:hypothetical protein